MNRSKSLMYGSSSLFDRFISRPRPVWLKMSVSLLLLLLPFGAAHLDGILGDFIRQGRWRVSLLFPTIIIYIWLISPAMTRVGVDVIYAMRPLLPMDDESFDSLIDGAFRANPVHEAIAFGIGAALGIASVLASGDETASWLGSYWFLTAALMYGLLAWTIYGSATSTRLNAVLHNQPLRFDVLDPSPFEAIGRQSLLLALAFMGGISLSLIFAFQLESLSSPLFWLMYLFLVLVTVLIFFQNMRPTHQVLVAAKNRELEPVQRHIRQACRSLVKRLDQGQDSGTLAAEINALVVYEQRLQAARTWPYNTTMLRTLFFSVFIPLVTVLARVVAEILFR
jgi:hypothetical protein